MTPPQPTALPGLWLLAARPAHDARGSFERLWCAAEFGAAGLALQPRQWSLARNPRPHTLRGLHWQAAPQAETKLVRLLRGRVFDVVLDLRPGSPTRGRWAGFVLDAEQGPHSALLLPPLCAHGYLTLTPDCDLLYAMDAAHAPEAARGLRWNDPALGIAWPALPALVSERDQAWPAATPELLGAPQAQAASAMARRP